MAPALAQLTNGTAPIDGELCALDETGKPNFTLLKISLDGRRPVVFYAFDCQAASNVGTRSASTIDLMP